MIEACIHCRPLSFYRKSFFVKNLVVRKNFCNFVPNQAYSHLSDMKPRLITLLLTLLTLALQASADEIGYNAERPLIFGIDMDYPPMQYVDENGEAKGVDIEFTKLLMKRLGIPFTYAPNTWANIANDVLHGEVDLGMMVYSSYRKDSTNYSRAVFRLYYQIVYRKDGKQLNGLRDLGGKSIAFMSSRPVIDTLQSIGATPVIVKSLSQALRELSAGKYDAVICFRYQTSHYLATYHLDNLAASDLALMPREYCYVSRDKALIDKIDSEPNKMEQEGIIDDVYSGVKTDFGRLAIPRWVWWLLGSVIILALSGLLYQSRLNQKKLRKEMLRAQRSEELKGIFLSNVSHPLRTPLNAVIGFSDVLMNDEAGLMPAEERIHLLELINKNGLDLLHFINELLELSNIEGNETLYERLVTDIEQEMDSYGREVALQLTERVRFRMEAPSAGMRAYLDPKLMRIVTMHLLENAVHHTAEGEIVLSYDRKDDGLYVSVTDTGEGLPDDIRENIFALLSDENTFTREETPGLGLSICKAVVQKSGGRIGAESPEGGGTRMWFWVPVKILN